MQHLSSSGGTRITDAAAADLLTRITGRFYTPAPIGEALAADLARNALTCFTNDNEIRVIDPFCGDGRLISWLLRAANEVETASHLRWDIHLWDNDQSALSFAAKSVRSDLETLGADGQVTVQNGDSFSRGANRRQLFDIVITNPPWDRLKPDAREIISLSKKTAEAHLRWLRAQSKLLATLYPWSVPSCRFGGWGINLARCGMELSLGLLRPHGWCGAVTPASFFADQVSAPLRQWFFRRFAVRSIAYFPAEAKLFESVDQPAATVVAQAVPPHSVTDVRVYDRNLKHEDFKIDSSLATAQEL